MTYAERDRILKSLGYFDYGEYLQSALWRCIRSDVMRRASGKCHLCKAKAHEVHHRSYSEFVLTGEERDDNCLVALCHPCHTAIEFRGKAKRTFDEVEITLRRMEARGTRKRTCKPRKPATIKPSKRRTCCRCKERPAATNYFGQESKFCSHCKGRTNSAMAAQLADRKAKHDLPASDKRCTSCGQAVKMHLWGEPDRRCDTCNARIKSLIKYQRIDMQSNN